MQRNLWRGPGRARPDSGTRRWASKRGLLVELIAAPFALGAMLVLLAVTLLFGALRERD